MKHLTSILLILVLTSCNLSQKIKEAKCNRALKKISKLELKKVKFENRLADIGCKSLVIPKEIETSSDTFYVFDTIPEIIIDEGYSFWCNQLGQLVTNYKGENDSLWRVIANGKRIIYKDKLVFTSDSSAILSVQSGCKAQLDSLQLILTNKTKQINEIQYKLDESQNKLTTYDKWFNILRWIFYIILAIGGLILITYLIRIFKK